MQTTNADIGFAETQVDLACFEVGGRLFAFEVGQVREVVRDHAATPLPNAPELIDGVVDLRGTVVPIVDLGRALAGTPIAADAPHARIFVVEVDALVLGLRVEAAVDVLRLPIEALEDPPALAVQIGYDAVRAVVRRNNEPPVLVLSLDSILERVFRSALDAGAAVV